MKIFDVELDFDFLDADQLEIYERENQRVAEDINEKSQYEGKSTADSLRIQCRIVDRFFDAVFGEGTAEKLFHGKNNIRDHMEAFGIVAQGARNARAEFDAMEDKYSPNRAQRRQMERENGQNQKQGSGNYYKVAAGKNKRHKHRN